MDIYVGLSQASAMTIVKTCPIKVNSVCDRFLERIAVMPPDWDWQRIKPEILVRDITPLLSLSGKAIARSLMRQSMQPILLEKNGSCICY